MHKNNILTLNFYDAVISNNGMEVHKILKDNSSSQDKIPLRTITGLLVMAIENKLIQSAKAILEYNTYSIDKITNKHLDAILYLAAKLDLLKELDITYH